MNIISRANAKAAGLKRYFTGIPCKFGHIAERMVSSPHCVLCMAEYRTKNYEKHRAADHVRAVARYAANKEKAKAAAAKWAADNRERVVANNAKRYATHRVKMRADTAKRYAENPEKVKAYVKKWRALNPGAARIHNENRRARKRNSLGGLSRGLVAKLFKLQKGLCPCCRGSLLEGYHLDHIVPLSLGGAHEDSNMQLLRSKCNNTKRAKHPVDFMQSRGFLL